MTLTFHFSFTSLCATTSKHYVSAACSSEKELTLFMHFKEGNFPEKGLFFPILPYDDQQQTGGDALVFSTFYSPLHHWAHLMEPDADFLFMLAAKTDEKCKFIVASKRVIARPAGC